MIQTPITAIVETKFGLKEANPNDKNVILLEDIFSFPFLIYSYNQDNKFTSVNNFMLSSHELNSIHDIIGKRPLQIFKKQDALQLEKNNNIVFQNNKPLVFEETVEISDFFSINALSYKIPLYNSSGIKIGILGISTLNLDQNSLIKALKNSGLNSLAKKITPLNLFTIDNITLSTRQSQCFYLLTQGKSAKQIAKLFDRNPRTVETHIEILKNKLSCSSTRELIEKGFHFFIENKFKIARKSYNL